MTGHSCCRSDHPRHTFDNKKTRHTVTHHRSPGLLALFGQTQGEITCPLFLYVSFSGRHPIEKTLWLHSADLFWYILSTCFLSFFGAFERYRR